MKQQHDNNPLQSYESALADLRSDAHNVQARHQAVLALARLGSLEFAIREYERYGLHKVRNHEDIMALGARLSKDLYLNSTGRVALEHARNSSEKYEAAFQDTRGFYSGVNAATMAFLADVPADIVTDRARTVAELLPARSDLSPADHYYVEATRAECFLLLGEVENAKDILLNAIRFDPLNYIAHASTLKQLGLILNKMNMDKRWLDPFKPPRPTHFAGHIWDADTPMPDTLRAQISDSIQNHDIGFAYGALAAGADIEIAEALIEEGVELNVVLPHSPQRFLEHSVRPYGEAWVLRFKTCLEKACSVTSLPEPCSEKYGLNNLLGAQLAMGQAIMRSQHLDVHPIQLLINDPRRKSSLTTAHKLDWNEVGHETTELFIEHKNPPSPKLHTHTENIPVILLRPEANTVETFPSLQDAMDRVSQNAFENYGLHFQLHDAEIDLKRVMKHNPMEKALVSETVAGVVALKYMKDYEVIYAGSLPKGPDNHTIRCYTLRAKKDLL